MTISHESVLTNVLCQMMRENGIIDSEKPTWLVEATVVAAVTITFLTVVAR